AHRFHNGALWLFTFYMLTDPKTTPLQRWGRVWHASVVALLAFFLSEWWYWKDTFLWALLFAAPLVPTLDWLQDNTRLVVNKVEVEKEEFAMKHQLARSIPVLLGLAVVWRTQGHAVCVFLFARGVARL